MKKILFLMLASSTAHAGGLAVAEQNAVSAGTGGAGAARDDDPGAAWHAPAALADDGGLRIGLSLALAHPSLQARGDDWSADTESKWSTPPHLDASFAMDRWAAGIAIGVPFGGGVTWPTTWPGATQAVRTELMVIRFAPFAAYRVGPIRFSAGMHFDAARLQIQRNLDFIDMQGDVRLDLAGQGFGVDASAYYTPREDIAVGLTYRSRTRFDFAGNANFTAPDAFSEKTPDQTAATTMTMPDQIVLGARWRRGALTALADVEHTRWSINQRTTVDFTHDATPNAIQENGWHDTWAVRAGAEWRHTPKLTARAGGYFDPSPVPAEHLTPSSPDSTRVAATAGVSYRVAPAWTADGFAEHMWLLRRDTTSVDTMPASYGGTAIVVGAGVRWTPAAR
ncbi:MAG TPA: outer membrane protein transport protein [Kofleriaceae bacterium]